MPPEPDPRPSGRITELPPEDYLGAITQRYVSGETPWDTGVPNPELVRVVEAGGLPGRSLLEIGSGTGTNAVELAKRGYQVTAVDLVGLAVQRGIDRAKEAGVSVRFLTGDFTKLELGGPFESVFDSGVYHGIRQRDLSGFVSALQLLTRPKSRWLSLTGSSRDQNPNGPPTVSETEIRRELETTFRVLELKEFRLNLRSDLSPLFWSILMERR
jgi:SAM-dependent methyltransferase